VADARATGNVIALSWRHPVAEAHHDEMHRADSPKARKRVS